MPENSEVGDLDRETSEMVVCSYDHYDTRRPLSYVTIRARPNERVCLVFMSEARYAISNRRNGTFDRLRLRTIDVCMHGYQRNIREYFKSAASSALAVILIKL